MYVIKFQRNNNISKAAKKLGVLHPWLSQIHNKWLDYKANQTIQLRRLLFLLHEPERSFINGDSETKRTSLRSVGTKFVLMDKILVFKPQKWLALVNNICEEQNVISATFERIGFGLGKRKTADKSAVFPVWHGANHWTRTKVSQVILDWATLMPIIMPWRPYLSVTISRGIFYPN